MPGGTQLALPLDLPAPPDAQGAVDWEAMLADYGTMGMTDQHASARAAARTAAATDAVTSRDLETIDARQAGPERGDWSWRASGPGTANGIVFILLEDEYGTINLIVPPPVYERHRLTVRTEPLMLVEGKLERLRPAGGAINVLVDKSRRSPRPIGCSPRSRTSRCSTNRSAEGSRNSGRPARQRTKTSARLLRR